MIHVLQRTAARQLLFGLPLFLFTLLPVASQHMSAGLIFGASADARHLGGGTDLAPSGWSIGASALLQPFYPFGIRGDAVYSSINRKFLFSSNAGADTADIDFSLLSIPLYLRFELKESGLVPYLYAGTTVGVIVAAIDNNAVSLVDRKADGELYNTFSATADLGVGGNVSGGEEAQSERRSARFLGTPGDGPGRSRGLGIRPDRACDRPLLQDLLNLRYKKYFE